MKRAILFIFVAIFLLYGCTQVKAPSLGVDGKFSYSQDYAVFKDEAGVKHTGFVNTERTEVNSKEQAVELAKIECTIDYDMIVVDYDADMDIYRVCFFKRSVLGGDQTIYINQSGITQLIVYSE